MSQWVVRLKQQWIAWLALTAAMLFALTSVVAADGYDKLQISDHGGGNPALIGQDGFLRLFVGSRFGLGNNLLPPKDIVEQFRDSEVADSLLDILPPEGLQVWVGNGNLLSLGIGPVEIRTNVNLFGAMQVRPDLIELGVNDPEVGRSYDADGTEAEWSGYASLSAGGALGLPAVAKGLGWDSFRIGGRVHALSGLGYNRVAINGNVDVLDDGFNGKLVGELWSRPAESDLWTAGQGYAFDVGIQGQLSDRWTIGVSVANIGRLTWDNVHYERFESEIVVIGGTDAELEWNKVAEDTSSLVWHLPRRVEGSLGYRATDTLNIGIGVVQTTYFDHDGRPADARTDLNANVVWNGIPFLPLSAGVNYSGASGWSLSTGAALDLGPIHVVGQIENLPMPKTGRELGASIGIGLAF